MSHQLKVKFKNCHTVNSLSLAYVEWTYSTWNGLSLTRRIDLSYYAYLLDLWRSVENWNFQFLSIK